MSAADPPAPAPTAEERRLLREREREEERRALEAARDLAPGECPACGERVHAGQVPPLLAPLVGRPPLACEGCGLEAPPRPSALGWALGVGAAAALVIAGMLVIFAAQEKGAGTQRLLTFAAGGLLFVGGMYLGYGVQGTSQPNAVARQLLRVRRRSEAERLGGPAEPPPPSAFGENLKEIVFAAILYLVIRHFVLEAFVIPTGSMAPTLLGNHYDVQCVRCAYPYEVGAKEGEFRGVPERAVETRCPVCGEVFSVAVEPGDVDGGNKILVNKFLYDVRPPERYDVIVFKYPENPAVNYIKRLIGLPGETIEVHDGDVYVDGKLARKPDAVQDAVWLPVHDGRFPYEEIAFEWAVSEGPGEAWKIDVAGDPPRERIAARPPGDEPVWLSYRPSPDGVLTTYGYNRLSASRGGSPAGDLRVQAVVTPEAGAVVRLAAVEDGRVVAARFEAGEGDAVVAVEVAGEVVAEVEHPALRPGTPVTLGIAYADERARVLVEGATVLEWLDDGEPDLAAGDDYATARLSAARAGAVFEAVRIDRDIYYVPHGQSAPFDPVYGPVEVPEGKYFAMGDNSPNSQDGRAWGFVDEAHLLGRAFVVWWPLWEGRLVR